MNQTCNYNVATQDFWDVTVIGFLLQLKKKEKKKRKKIEIAHTPHRYMHTQNLQRLNHPSYN